MLTAARRFRGAWEGDRERSAQGDVLTDPEIVEMHEAALGLIWATGTTCSEPWTSCTSSTPDGDPALGSFAAAH